VVKVAAVSVRERAAVFCFALLFVLSFDAMWTGKRYPYAADSASYVEMAQTLLQDGHPRVTPWDFAEGSADRIPQKLFPPGYPVLIAAASPLTGSVRTAALIPSRLAAVLIPVLILSLFAGAMPTRSLMLLSVYAILTPGVRGWQYAAYSDVPALAVSVLALGALARGLQLVGETRRPLWWCLLAGVAAGCAYAIRNAGIAVLAIAVVMLAEAIWRRRALREAGAVAFGAAAPLAALWAYNLSTFGRLQPYSMPASTRPWTANVADWAGATFTDMGIPWQIAEHLPRVVSMSVIAIIAAVLIAGFFSQRLEPRRRSLLLLVGGYALGGALLLILSRSRFEWGNFIDERNTLQYTWALIFALALALPAVVSERAGVVLARMARLAVLLVLLFAMVDAWRVGTAPAEPWQLLSADAAVVDAARVTDGTLLASNQAVLFRISAGAPVRNVEIGGDDRKLWRALEAIRSAAAGRPARLILVCDGYTKGYSACGGAEVPAVAPPDCVVIRSLPPRVLSCPVPIEGAAL
jgi:4-amino-4-deoxy-L-arabinose transferase-like glycosyltransferase